MRKDQGRSNLGGSRTNALYDCVPYWSVLWIRITLMRIRIRLTILMRIRIRLITLMRIRMRIRTVFFYLMRIRILFDADTDPAFHPGFRILIQIQILAFK
jgi:hypothetical protein